MKAQPSFRTPQLALGAVLLEAEKVFAPAANDSKKPNPSETPHQKVFALIRERKIKEAARLAARLINAGDVDGFLIYGTGREYRSAEDWFRDQVALGRRGVHTLVHTVTPYLAQVFLQNNTANRRVSPKNLEDVIRDILSGEWDLNGESIKFSREGLLNDAQHRNFGVLLTGENIKSVIVFGLQRASNRTVDKGRKRTGADQAGTRGEKNAVVLSAAAALAFHLYEGRAGTAVETDDYLIENGDKLREGLAAAGTGSIPKIGHAAPVVAATHLLGIGAHRDDLREFFHIVRTGLVEKNTDPARAIYNALNPARVSDAPMKKSALEWVPVLCQHFVLRQRGKRIKDVAPSTEMPEAL